MKRLIVIAFISLPLMAMSQVSVMNTVPKQISLDAGYRIMAGSEIANKASNGYSVMLDYAWQLSGFSGKHASFISVPLGYTQMFPDTDTSRSVRVISYGWTVRHELKSQQGYVPFIGYGLLLNNYHENGIDGHNFAHQTRFAVGLNNYNKSSFQPYAELSYSMTYYPQMGTKGSLSYKFMELKIGARFMKKKA